MLYGFAPDDKVDTALRYGFLKFGFELIWRSITSALLKIEGIGLAS